MKQLRQQRAIERMTSQLESGVKTKKGTRDEKIPLTDKDKARILRDIERTKKNIKS